MVRGGDARGGGGQFEPPVHDQAPQGKGPADAKNFRVDPPAGPAGDVPKKADTRVPIAHGGVGGDACVIIEWWL